MKLNILFAVLLILATISFAQSGENRIDRPWEDGLMWEKNNPYIYFLNINSALNSPLCTGSAVGTPIVGVASTVPCSSLVYLSMTNDEVPLYTGAMDYSLDVMELEDTLELTEGQTEIYEKINLALQAREDAASEKKTAEDELTQALAEMPSEAAVGAGSGCGVGGGIGAIAGAGAVGVGAIPGAIGGCIVGSVFGAALGVVGGSTNLITSSVDSVDAYFNYGNYWKSAMDNSLEAFELSLDKADNAINLAMQKHDDVMFTGICDEDYPGSFEICGNLSSAYSVIENKVPEGSYGKYITLGGYKENISEEVWNDIPNMTLYYPAMELIWAEDGIVNMYTSLDTEGQKAIEDADDIYNQHKSDAADAKKDVNAKYNKLKGENLQKITVPVAVGSIDPERIGAINERYDTIEDEKEDADRLYADAKDMVDSDWKQGYLKNATIMMYSAKETYDSLDEKIELLLDDAELAVEQARDEAQEKISEAEAQESTMGTSGKDNLADARSALSKGDSASKLGDQYEKYVEALTYAQNALGDKSYYEEQEIELKKIEIEELISKAKDDGIDVTSEEKELDILDPNAPDIMHRLNSLKERILGKAEMQYLYLQDEHDELYDMLTTAGADDLLDDMEAAETGIVFSGRVDYEQGLGRLKGLASAYEDIREDFEENLEDMNNLVANSIVTDPSLVIGKVNIDEPTDLTLNVLFVNKKDYAGTDVEVRVEVPGKFKFDYFDITKGAEDVVGLSTTGYKLDITLDSIDAFETKSVTFEKSQVLATTKSEEESAVGLGDGSAKVEKSIVFDLEAENVYVAIPESWATGVSIDGISANRPLSKGVHTLSMSYNVEDAYTEERGETIAEYTGETETTVSYSITVTPNVELDSVPVIVDIGNTEQLTDVDISCVEYACDVEGTKVEIFNVNENSPATVQVSYTVSDLENYVRTELDKFSGVIEPDLVALYESAESFYSLGNYKLALTKMEELKDKSSDIEKDKSKLMRKYSDLRRDIENELDDLESAVSKADELDAGNSSMIDLFESRDEELSGILGETGNISSSSAYSEIQDAVDTLEKVDRNWLKKQTKSYLKEATKKLEDYREEFVEYDNDTADDMLENLEHDINVLAATQNAESAVVVIADIEALEGILDGLENELYVETEELRIEFQALKDEMEALLSHYSIEQKTAKGTSIENIFSISESSVTRIISDIEKNIGEKPNDYIENRMEDLEDKKEGIDKILSEAETQAKGKLNSIKSVYAAKSEGFSEDDKTYISGQILEAEQMISAGNYAGAVKKGDAVIDLINETEVQDNTFLILLLASLVVVAVVIVYMIRQQKPKKPKIKLEKEIKQEEKKEKKKD